MSDLQVINEGQQLAPTDMFQMPPLQKMEYAGQIANVLKDVIKKQKLYTKIGPKEHVNIEGWSTLGSLLGILPKENRVIKLDCGGYEAHVDLINKSDGVICGGASSICSRKEKMWGKNDDFAVRSMAITRATGKAYRLAFAWIINLAGYSGTPLEEMPMPTAKPTQARAAKPEGFNKNVAAHRQFIDKQYPAVVEWDAVKKDELYDRINGLTGAAVGKIVTEMSV